MYAVIPGRAKPSKSASKDPTRPILNHAELRETADGWELVTCDSYQLARVPLDVKEDSDEPLTPGPITPEALKAIEKSRGFRANGTVEPCDATTGYPSGQTFTRPTDLGTFPNWDQLIPEAPAREDEFVIGLDATLLHSLAQSLDVDGKRGGVNQVFLRVSLPAYVDSPRRLTKPIAVSKNGVDYNGLLMPVRVPS